MGLAKAKDEALALTLAVKEGKDPLAIRSAESVAETFGALAERYMAEHRRKNARGEKESRSTIEAQRMLDVNILPALGDHRAEAVTKKNVLEVVEKVADRGAYVAADKVLGLINLQLGQCHWAARNKSDARLEEAQHEQGSRARVIRCGDPGFLAGA
jgi:hypothetical protein